MHTRSSQISWIILTATVVAAGAGLYYPFSRAAAQQHNISLARAHAYTLAPTMLSNERFAGVRAVESARDGGSLLVVGTVVTDDDLNNLRDFVEKSNCPVKVIWSVNTVLTPSTTEPSSINM